MEITDFKPYSVKELIARLRDLTMLEDRNSKPYANAEITLTDIGADLLRPAQCYVLRAEFEKVRSLRWAMLKQHKVDILRLCDSRMLPTRELSAAGGAGTEQVGFVEFKLASHPDQTITILPIVVETQAEANTLSNHLINDGMHRAFLARSSWVTPAVVRISKVPVPYYAFPLAGGWADVRLVKELRSDYLKKFHRFPDYKRYYRDFNSVFQNVGGPRGAGKPAPAPALAAAGT